MTDQAPHIYWQFRLNMALIHSLFMFIYMIVGLTEAAYHFCYSNGNFTKGSAYETNRDAFIYDMPTEIPSQGGYQHYSSAGQGTAAVFCLGLCRNDIISSDMDLCSACIHDAAYAIKNYCTFRKEAIAWGEDAGCVVRCAPNEFQHTSEREPTVSSCNGSSVLPDHLPQFRLTFANLTRMVAKTAADVGHLSSFSQGNESPKYFAAEESKVGGFKTIYALGFCLPTLSQSACAACLVSAANESEKHCNGKQGASIFMPSCILRYELYRFYKVSSPSSHPASFPLDVKREGKSSRTLVIAIVVPVIFFATVIIFIACTTIILKIKRKGADQAGAESSDSFHEFSLDAVRVATKEFSNCNKLGQGGFGVVYKGKLRNGQQIAVKRLSVHSLRGEKEFKNEGQLLARLCHKNLIRLIGFCLEGDERLLIYELAVNGSLDRFLFDSVRRENLTWEVRCNIIEGITRGLLYLHEESQLRIIHHDLKPSNILLDEWMNPKISDFGTARLYVEDQGSASRIAGTYGYMSPEYVKHGKISTKMDVFSFGVVLLEIVCGKRNNESKNSRHVDHLLSKAWKHWAAGDFVKLIDPVLLKRSHQIDEMKRCMHIGLLCAQENAESRPTMNSVILMLEGSLHGLPPPLKPAYFMDFGDEPNVAMGQDRSLYSEADPSQQTSVLSFPHSSFSSVNEISITQSYPDPR